MSVIERLNRALSDRRFMMIEEVSDPAPGMDSGDLVMIRNWFAEMEPGPPLP